MSAAALFTPPYPPRPQDYAPVWRGFFGERVRNVIYSWPTTAYEDRYKYRKLLGYRLHFIFDPDVVGHVLLDNKENYRRPRAVQRILGPVIGNGLLSSEGDDWRVQRKIVAPTFAPGAVSAMAPIIAEATRAQIAGWDKVAFRTDMAHAATDLTATIISNTLFSGDKRLQSKQGRQAIDALLQASGNARLSVLLGIEQFDFSSAMRKGRAGRDYLRTTLGTLVAERGESGGTDDFFGGLIRSLRANFTGDQATELAIDNAITFYVAGHETTANALAWTIYLLAAQPELQNRAREEAVAAISGDPATLADRLPYLRQLLDESMRLYPPAPRFDREAVAPDSIGEIEVEAGDYMSIWPWLMHRNKGLWENADAFDPERFSPPRKALLHRHQYIPFGAGPRVCVGARFAIVEALIVLAHWLSAREFVLLGGTRIAPRGSVTLRPDFGVPLLVKPL